MANSKYEYVKQFEQPDAVLPNTWIVVRIDGRGFTKFCSRYAFEKPNDKNGIALMNAAAKAVVAELPDITIAYGVSDEFSFVFHRSTTLFQRRASKIVSTVVSTFTAFYVHLWPTYFPDKPLLPPLPNFDGRAVAYPTIQNLRDYMSWRQVDCHINNLYNTAFWTLIQLGGQDPQEAFKMLNVTSSAEKNELLFSKFSINYNNEPEMFRKGSVVFRDYELVEIAHPMPGVTEDDLLDSSEQSKTQAEKDRKKRAKARVVCEHVDIIQDEFWQKRPWLLSNQPGKIPKAN